MSVPKGKRILLILKNEYFTIEFQNMDYFPENNFEILTCKSTVSRQGFCRER